MKIVSAKKLALGVAVASAFCGLGISVANAHTVEKEGYLIDTRNNVVKNSYNECWRTGYWTPAMAIAECDPDLVKKEPPKVAPPSAPVKEEPKAKTSPPVAPPAPPATPVQKEPVKPAVQAMQSEEEEDDDDEDDMQYQGGMPFFGGMMPYPGYQGGMPYQGYPGGMPYQGYPGGMPYQGEMPYMPYQGGMPYQQGGMPFMPYQQGGMPFMPYQGGMPYQQGEMPFMPYMPYKPYQGGVPYQGMPYMSGMPVQSMPMGMPVQSWPMQGMPSMHYQPAASAEAPDMPMIPAMQMNYFEPDQKPYFGPDAPAVKADFWAEALFEFDKTVLKPGAKQALFDYIVLPMREHPEVEMLLVTGHTDRIGSAKYNQKLSERRAAAVKAYLVEQGISPTRIRTVGKGETEPNPNANTQKECHHMPAKKLIACLQPDRRVTVEPEIQVPVVK